MFFFNNTKSYKNVTKSITKIWLGQNTTRLYYNVLLKSS